MLVAVGCYSMFGSIDSGMVVERLRKVNIDVDASAEELGGGLRGLVDRESRIKDLVLLELPFV
jgi:hypothetical protein